MRYKNTLLLALLTAVLLIVFTSAAAAVTCIRGSDCYEETINPSPVNIVLDGAVIYDEAHPVIIADRLFVPVRAIAAAFGWDVSWDQDTRMVVVSGTSHSGYDFSIKLKPGTSQLAGNLPDQIMTAADSELQNAVPIIIEGSTMAPIRFLAVILDVPVNWDSASRTVYLNQSEEDEDNQAGDEAIKIYSENNDGQTITIQKGEVIRIELASNPTTGFTWITNEEPDPSTAVFTEFDYIHDSTDTAIIVGAGGKECWQIKAVNSGTTNLTLWYMRPWESVPPLHTFHLQIKVI